MKSRVKACTCFFLLIMLLLPGCAFSPQEDVREAGKEIQEEDKIKVITTIFPLADIVHKIGGEKIKVTNLLEPGDSPHTFEPTVEQARKVARADLMFYIGEGLDDWAVSLAEGEGVPQVLVMDYIKEEKILDYEPLHLEQNEHYHHDNEHHKEDYGNEDGDGHNDHYHGPHDPHVWMDPILVKKIIAPLTAEKLIDTLPEEELYFTENLERFQDKLAELDSEIRTTVDNFSRTEFISYHSAWNYYAERYGLVEVASVEEFPGREPSARWLAELTHLAEKYGIEVIFAEPQLSEENARVIADEIGGEVLILDPLGGKEVPQRDCYLELVRYNTEIFQEALE